MTFSPQARLKTVATVVTLVVIGIVVKELLLPAYVRGKLQRAAARAGCKLSLGSLRLSFVPMAIDATGVSLSAGTPGETAIDAKVDNITVPFSLMALLRGHLRLGDVRAARPQVVVEEGDGKSPPKPPHRSSPPDFEVTSLAFRQGEFSYVRNHLDQRAAIHVHEIDGEVGHFGGTEPLRALPAKGRARGRLEKSGHFGLNVGAILFGETPHVDVHLEIERQVLSDVNGFFHRSEGVRLEGELIRGEGTVAVRGGSLTSWVTTTYRDFQVLVEATAERSALSAFLMGIVSSLKLETRNTTTPAADRTRTTALRREPDETLIAFILRGLKEAAIKTASGPRPSQ